jgi:hypothetical protein
MQRNINNYSNSNNPNRNFRQQINYRGRKATTYRRNLFLNTQRISARYRRRNNPNINNYNYTRRSNNTGYYDNNNNNIARYNSNYNAKQYRDLNRKIKQITDLVKTTSLTGAPRIGVNSDQRKNTNNPNISKEIRYDKLYNAMQMYKMGKYYSFYKTPSMIVRLALYSCYQFSLDVDTTGSFLWLPYFFPYISPNFKVDTSGLNMTPNVACNFITRSGNSQLYHPSSIVDTMGSYRLITASLKISNTTTNSQKGGSYTIYRVCRNEGQPVLTNSNVEISFNEAVAVTNTEVMSTKYDNEPTKYLYTANQIALINEYGVIEGNTIFQQVHEYMGNRSSESTSNSLLPLGGFPKDFNPDGVNVKYVAKFEAPTTKQSYTAQAFTVFEFIPVSTSVMATMAFKGSQSVLPQVVQQAKNSFNLQVLKD